MPGGEEVTDLDGDALEEIAPLWVLEEGELLDSTQEGQSANVPNQVPIACPFPTSC